MTHSCLVLVAFVVLCGLSVLAAPRKCGRPLKVGKKCNGKPVANRFYFSAADNDCHQFQFLGCSGNNNNFRSMRQCQLQCGVKTSDKNKVKKEKVQRNKKGKGKGKGKGRKGGKKSCLEGWTAFKSRKCVQIVSDELKWASARAVCQGLGGDLVVFKKRNFWKFVIGLLDKSKRYWIGLNDLNHDGQFTWLDENKPIKFTKWLRPPINETGSEWCVEMAPNHKGKWNDKNCEFRRSAICQMNPVKGKRGLRRAQRKADKFEKRRQRKKEKYQKRRSAERVLSIME